MNRMIFASMLPCIAVALFGCDARRAGGPPDIRLGDSICAECNMIISDERWATATVIDGERGAEPRLFDDFNCQVNYESGHPEEAVLARWSHSHATGEWIRTEAAYFLLSPGLRTPMGSNCAAFATADEAAAAEAEFPGEGLAFDAAWERLSPAATDAAPRPGLEQGRPDEP